MCERDAGFTLCEELRDRVDVLLLGDIGGRDDFRGDRVILADEHEEVGVGEERAQLA